MKKKVLLLMIFFMFLDLNVFSQTVYINNTGAKYHKEGYQYLSKSQIAINLSEAIAQGSDAWNVCKPPTNNQTEATKLKTQKDSISSKINTTQSVSVQCSATTKVGTRCKKMTKIFNSKC